MMGGSRFQCASSGLTLKTLLSKAKRVLWGCLGLGILLHLSLTQIGGGDIEDKAAPPDAAGPPSSQQIAGRASTVRGLPAVE